MSASPETVAGLGALNAGLAIGQTIMNVQSLALRQDQAKNQGVSFAIGHEQDRTRLAEIAGKNQARRLNLLQQQSEQVRRAAQVISGNEVDAVASGLDVTSGSVRQTQRALKRRQSFQDLVSQYSLSEIEGADAALERRRYITRIAENASARGAAATRDLLRLNQRLAVIGGTTSLIASYAGTRAGLRNFTGGSNDDIGRPLSGFDRANQIPSLSR